MKRSTVLAGMVLVMAGMTWGQTGTTTKPAVHETMQGIKADMAANTISNPTFESIISKFPEKLTVVPQGSTAQIQQGKDLGTWDAANADGKTITVEAVYTGNKDARFFVPGQEMRRVNVRSLGDNVFQGLVPGDRVSIAGTIGRRGLACIANKWPTGETLYDYTLVLLKATTKKSSPAATSQTSPG